MVEIKCARRALEEIQSYLIFGVVQEIIRTSGHSHVSRLSAFCPICLDENCLPAEENQQTNED